MTISINKLIKQNNPFRLSYKQPSKSLIESINFFGIISPPKLFDIEGSYYIFDGNKRITVLQNAGIENTECIIIKTDSLKKAFNIFLEEKYPVPPSSSIIKSRGYKTAVKFFNQIPDHVRLKLGLPKNKNDIELIDMILNLDQVSAAFLENNEISLKQIRPIMRLGIKKTSYFIDKLAIPLSLNANKFSKALEILGDIETAGNNSLKLMDSFIGKTELKPENKANIREDFFIYIDKLRRPALNKNLEEFSKISEKLLGPDIRLNPFNFENNKITFSFDAKNPVEAVSRITTFQNAVNDKNFTDLFKKI